MRVVVKAWFPSRPDAGSSPSLAGDRRHHDPGVHRMPPLSKSRPLLADTARRRALASLFRAVAAAAALAVLGACGGGGGGGAAPEPPPPSPPPPAPAPTPASTGPIAAQLSVPTPVGYDADRLAAFNRLNEVRLAAGLGMLAQSVALDQAAQAHADWIVENDSFTHDETAGTTGFTGVHWWERDEALGYVPVGGSEVVAGVVHGAQGVDVLVNGVYHRAGILMFESVDVGIGWNGGAAASISMPLVMDITQPGIDPVRGLGQSAQASINGIATWPVDGARGVPLRLGLESPNPVPTQDVLSLGTPASITVGADQTVAVASFVMSNASTGATVSTRTLTSQSDPNLLLPASFVALVPLEALAPNTAYRVAFMGSTTGFPSGAIVPVDRTWSFTTASR
jgi:hypothetical protein